MEPNESAAGIGKIGSVGATTGAMLRWIAAIDDLGALDRYPAEMAGTAETLMRDGADALHTCRVISGLHDALVARLIELARPELGPPPCSYAWIALGSAGRMEQVSNSLILPGLLRGGASSTTSRTSWRPLSS